MTGSRLNVLHKFCRYQAKNNSFSSCILILRSNRNKETLASMEKTIAIVKSIYWQFGHTESIWKCDAALKYPNAVRILVISRNK